MFVDVGVELEEVADDAWDYEESKSDAAVDGFWNTRDEFVPY